MGALLREIVFVTLSYVRAFSILIRGALRS